MSEFTWDPSQPFKPSEHPAAVEMGRDICVSAGAGCGKTSILVARAINLILKRAIPPERILAITFTDKAANEMKRRIMDELERSGRGRWWEDVENAPISTIHSFCASLLRERAIPAGVDPDFIVLDEHQATLLLRSSLDEALEEAFAGDGREEMFRLTTRMRDERGLREGILSAYEKVRSLGLPFSELTLLRGTEIPRAEGMGEDLVGANEEGRLDHERLTRRFIWLLQRLDDRYQDNKAMLLALDFDDLQLRARELLARAAIGDEYRQRFLQVLVDEFQDVNRLQDDLIARVASKGRLFIVGDVKQSIYRFRHAEVDIFRRRLEDARERENAWRVALQLNFRSRREILSFVNRVFSRAWQHDPIPYEELYFGAPLPDALQGPRIKVMLLPGKEEASSTETTRPLEAAFLARTVKDWVEKGTLHVFDPAERNMRPLRYGDIFMLFRSTSDIHLYEQALAREGVPYYSASGRGFFRRNEIQDTVSFLRAIDNPYDDLALASVLRSPWVGIGDATLAWLAKRGDGEPLLWRIQLASGATCLPDDESRRLAGFGDYLRSIVQARNRLTPGELVRRIVRENFFEARLLAQSNGQQRVANLRKFCWLVDDLGRTALSLGELLEHVEELSVVPLREGEAPLQPEGADVVTLMTWHAAKGLEKEMVILPDLSRRVPSRLPPALIDRDGRLGLALASAGSDATENEASEVVEEQREREKEADREEEKRMLYVAMTRAKEYLVLSGLKGEEMSCRGVEVGPAIADAPPNEVEILRIPAERGARRRPGPENH